MEMTRELTHFRLGNAAREGVSPYISEYTKLLPNLAHLHNSQEMTVGLVRALGTRDARSAIKSTLLYNDTCFLDIKDAGNQAIVHWLTKEGFKAICGSDEIYISSSNPFPEEFIEAVQNNSIGFGFFQAAGPDVEQLLSDAAALISAGRLVPKPNRQIFYSNPVDEGQPRNWQALTAGDTASLDAWRLEAEELPDIVATESIFDQEGCHVDIHEALSSISLPYIEGVSLTDYARIIDDEEDMVVEFRKEMRDLARLLKEGGEHVGEFRRDVIDVRVAKIARKFRQISELYLLRIGGAALATTTLSLVSLASGGLVAGAAALAGSMGAFTVVKEAADRRQQINSLRDDPLYLLWKLQAGGGA